MPRRVSRAFRPRYLPRLLADSTRCPPKASEIKYATFYHPIHDRCFLRLAAHDSRSGGIHHQTARLACEAMAYNMPGFFSTSVHPHDQINKGPNYILPPGRYYFHRADSAASPDYRICTTFRRWTFPPNGIPQPWAFLGPAQNTIEVHKKASWATISKRVERRDHHRCLVTGWKEPVVTAHIVPRTEQTWLDTNSIAQYLPDPYEPCNLDGRNLFTLRGDLHTLFDEAHFAIVPKNNHFVLHFLEKGSHYPFYYHNTRFKFKNRSGVSPTLLYIRFVGSIMHVAGRTMDRHFKRLDNDWHDHGGDSGRGDSGDGVGDGDGDDGSGDSGDDGGGGGGGGFRHIHIRSGTKNKGAAKGAARAEESRARIAADVILLILGVCGFLWISRRLNIALPIIVAWHGIMWMGRRLIGAQGVPDGEHDELPLTAQQPLAGSREDSPVEDSSGTDMTRRDPAHTHFLTEKFPASSHNGLPTADPSSTNTGLTPLIVNTDAAARGRKNFLHPMGFSSTNLGVTPFLFGTDASAPSGHSSFLVRTPNMHHTGTNVTPLISGTHAAARGGRLQLHTPNMPLLPDVNTDVLLEGLRLTTDGLSITGRVRVRNLAYIKSVVAHFTFDAWQTTEKVVAHFVHSPNPEFDTFAFTISLNNRLVTTEEKQMWLAVRYVVGEYETWDNNGGRNYLAEFSFAKTPAPYPSAMKRRRGARARSAETRRDPYPSH